MGEAQVLEGTTEEITARLREAYPEQTLRVTVEPQEEELLPDFADYPPTVTSEAQLVGLLLEALNSFKDGCDAQSHRRYLGAEEGGGSPPCGEAAGSLRHERVVVAP